MRLPLRIQGVGWHAGTSGPTKVARRSRDASLYFIIGYIYFFLGVRLTDPYNRGVR
jgi:hypothetical protein